MAFFKKVQKKVNNLWYPQSITWGKPVSTREVADKLAGLSTVTRGDMYAIMENLGGVMSDFMAQGRTVKLDGVGTFYYTAACNKQGVETAEEVSPKQINGVRVRFIPEVERDVNNKVLTRSMVDARVVWEEWGGVPSSGGGSTEEGGGTGEPGEDPLG